MCDIRRITLLPVSLLVFLSVLVFSVSPVSAQVAFSTDEARFISTNPNLAFQDFLGTFVAPDDLLLCLAPANSASDDDCFSPGQILPGIEFTIKPRRPERVELIVVGSDFDGNNNPTNPLIANQFPSGLDILFTAPDINAVGITAGCLLEGDPCTPRNMVVSVYGENGLLGSTVIMVSDSFDTFLGINTKKPIVEILLEQEDESPILTFQEGVLNVRFGTREFTGIPTLSEWGMIAAAAGLGLIGLFAVRRRMVRADS